MFVRQLNKRFYNLLTGGDRENITRAKAREIVANGRHVRCKDYVWNFETAGGVVETTITTTANWFFILSNASVWLDDSSQASDIAVKIIFEDSVQETPVTSPAVQDSNFVPGSLALSLQSAGGRFEEYKNLYWALGDRVNVTIKVKTNGEPARGVICLTGVEIDSSEGW
jgi:hypothetical protein